jgi:hypothetical protein
MSIMKKIKIILISLSLILGVFTAQAGIISSFFADTGKAVGNIILGNDPKTGKRVCVRQKEQCDEIKKQALKKKKKRKKTKKVKKALRKRAEAEYNYRNASHKRR